MWLQEALTPVGQGFLGTDSSQKSVHISVWNLSPQLYRKPNKCIGFPECTVVASCLRLLLGLQ